MTWSLARGPHSTRSGRCAQRSERRVGGTLPLLTVCLTTVSALHPAPGAASLMAAQDSVWQLQPPMSSSVCCVCLQEEELKAAIDKAVEAETRVSEAEIRMKEMKVGRTCSKPCQHDRSAVPGTGVAVCPGWGGRPCAAALQCSAHCVGGYMVFVAVCRRPLMQQTRLPRRCRSSCSRPSRLQRMRPARLPRCMLWRCRSCWWSAQNWR